MSLVDLAELSDSSAKITRLKKLSQKKYRQELSEFLVEGDSTIREGLKWEKISEVFATKEFLSKRENSDILALKNSESVSLELISEKSLKNIADTVTPTGMIANSRMTIENLSKAAAEDLSKIIYLDQIRDPGNAGTIIRAAAALNMDAVCFSPQSVEPTNPKTIRSSAGSFFQIPLFMMPQILDFQDGFQIFHTSAQGEIKIDEVSNQGKQIWIFSNEASGIREKIGLGVKIPINPRTESLNVAQAATIVMYQLSRNMHHEK